MTGARTSFGRHVTSGDLIGQNYLGWRAKESAQRYQTTFRGIYKMATGSGAGYETIGKIHSKEQPRRPFCGHT